LIKLAIVLKISKSSWNTVFVLFYLKVCLVLTDFECCVLTFQYAFTCTYLVQTTILSYIVFYMDIFRVSDKMVKKTPPNINKKNLPNHHSSTLSPQPFQSEKSFLHDKIKSKSPEKREKESLSFPEVKGAEGTIGWKSWYLSCVGNFLISHSMLEKCKHYYWTK